MVNIKHIILLLSMCMPIIVFFWGGGTQARGGNPSAPPTLLYCNPAMLHACLDILPHYDDTGKDWDGVQGPSLLFLHIAETSRA